jgi:hypothetical protein
MDRWNSPSFVDTNIKQLEYQIEIHVLTLKHRETVCYCQQSLS